MAQVLATQVELKVPAKAIWKAFAVDGHLLLPKVVPQVISSVEILEGDGGVGTVRLVKFGPAVPGIPTVKEKIETLDEEKLTISIVGLEGGPLGTLVSSTKVTTSFGPGADAGTSIAHWCLEVVPIGEQPPPPAEAEQGAIHTLKALEGYLLSQNN
ncbi:hypothetical protein O6H91_02G114200 [Diphasiastrum complanatum]|uniref:Uncharacterized protein n=2 Tax=Diphasiastrum complanatum TaxID=34168 RepID=A0ACC2EJR0_DIPCM|nr:hypothetical protein O6H91_02G114200 [Diphasiastrum complanatum]KAJ7566677.1 hypothetical protein O6H91_02G114200 [Diphasiastrum complanatum]